MAIEHLLDFLEIGRRRSEHTARAHDGLRHEGGHRVRPLGLDQIVQAVGETRREFLFAFSIPAVAVVTGCVRMQDPIDGQVEVVLHQRNRREAAACDGDTVIATLARDDLLLLRPIQRVVVVPDHLDGGVHRLGARVHQKHLAHVPGGDLDERFRELDHRYGRAVREGVRKGQGAELFDRGVDEALLAVAEARAP